MNEKKSKGKNVFLISLVTELVVDTIFTGNHKKKKNNENYTYLLVFSKKENIMVYSREADVTVNCWRSVQFNGGGETTDERRVYIILYALSNHTSVAFSIRSVVCGIRCGRRTCFFFSDRHIHFGFEIFFLRSSPKYLRFRSFKKTLNNFSSCLEILPFRWVVACAGRSEWDPGLLRGLTGCTGKSFSISPNR